MRITHADVWRKRPSEKNSFVSNEVHLAFPILRMKRIKKVLDVACGNGLGVSLPLLKEGYDVYSFDKWKASIKALEKNARKEGFKIRRRISDMYKKFPYKSSFFDASFCFQAIYHGSLTQIESALREIQRVTKKKGYFFGTFIPYYIKKDKGRFFFNYVKNDPALKCGACFEHARKSLAFSELKLQSVRLGDFRHTKNNGKIGRIYVKPDKNDPFLCYNLTKNCEYLVPHYYFTKDKLKSVLKKYFKDISVKKVSRKGKDMSVWFVCCRI